MFVVNNIFKIIIMFEIKIKFKLNFNLFLVNFC